jgi:hypothetical protein
LKIFLASKLTNPAAALYRRYECDLREAGIPEFFFADGRRTE